MSDCKNKTECVDWHKDIECAGNCTNYGDDCFIRKCVVKGEKELKRLLLSINPVTAQHRHHNLPTKKALDNLSNRQLEYEESMGVYTQICHLCKKEIPDQMVQQGGCHMHCYNTEIDVWFISLPDTPNHGFYEADPDQVMEQLKSAEHNDPYLIQRKNMVAGRYYNLPEFDGF